MSCNVKFKITKKNLKSQAKTQVVSCDWIELEEERKKYETADLNKYFSVELARVVKEIADKTQKRAKKNPLFLFMNYILPLCLNHMLYTLATT